MIFTGVRNGYITVRAKYRRTRQAYRNMRQRIHDYFAAHRVVRFVVFAPFKVVFFAVRVFVWVFITILAIGVPGFSGRDFDEIGEYWWYND